MTEVITRKVVANEEDLNRDPINGTPGAHPLGTGAGAASGGVAGAAVGTVVGGPAGKSAAEALNPTAEEIFWRETYLREPYYVKGRTYEYYAPGFRAGWEGRVRHDGRTFDAAEPELKARYNLTKTELDPDWQATRPAARAAWSRVDRNLKTKQ